MKLLRHGRTGQEKPGLLDNQGNIRDLSGVVEDIAGDVLAPDVLAEVAVLDTAKLPLVPAGVRLGPCTTLLQIGASSTPPATSTSPATMAPRRILR